MWILNIATITAHFQELFCDASHLKPRRYTRFFVVLLQHTQTTGTTKKSRKHAYSSDQSLQQSAQQIYFSSSDARATLGSVSQRSSDGFVGIRIYKNRDSRTFTCSVLTVQKREWDWGGTDNVSSQRYPVSQSGVIISWLMVKWCSLCQEHREKNDCLASTVSLQNSNDVMHD